jgi:hypothetical protein
VTRRSVAGELARDTARGFVEELLLLAVQVGLVVVPTAAGYVALGGWGMVIGLAVGLALLGAFWLWLVVTGVRGFWQAWRGTGRYSEAEDDPAGAQR